MKNLYSREEMLELNIETLKKRGVEIEEIALIAYNQQKKYTNDVSMEDCIESVKKILSLRDVFHHVQLSAEIDRMAEEHQFQGPIQDILLSDLGLFGIDEVLGLDISGLFGAIGQTNFGDIDVNKPGVCKRLNDLGKTGKYCHTFLDDIVGGIAAAASTRVAQMTNEETAKKDPHVIVNSLFDEIK